MNGWDSHRVRALRQRLGLSQAAFAQELGVRQQTVSEWETGRYEPRGASSRVLSMLAERHAVYDEAFERERRASSERNEDGDDR